MSLSGLLRVITDDPELRRTLDEADSPASPGGDLIAPPALRPFLVAALAGAGRAADSAATDADVAGAAHGAVTDAAGAADEGPSAGRARQRGTHRFVLAVTATAREAEDLTAALGSLLPEGAAAYFPPWETLPHERLSPRSDTSGQRLAVLRRRPPPAPARPPAPPPPGRPPPGALPAPAHGRRSG